MVYISPDGQIYNQQPWTTRRFFGLFTGFFGFIMAFFRTLTEPLTAIGNSGWSGSGDSSGGSRRGGGGGSGGSGRPGGGGGGGPRIGRIARMSDIRVPGGGCAGGSCGL